MELRVRPEPTDEEQRVLAAALAGDASPPSPYESGWRRSDEPDDDADGYAVARPRSNRGATRA